MSNLFSFFLITVMSCNTIFVFGSNLAGIHGAGAARDAVLKHRAVYEKNVTAHYGKRGQYGVGMQQNVETSQHRGGSYAIPTKDEFIKTLPIEKIRPYVEEFIEYAKETPELRFIVTRIGCGLAGYTDSEMSPLFKGIPDNVTLRYR